MLNEIPKKIPAPFRLQSVFDGDNVRLYLAVYSVLPEPLGDRIRREIGCFAEP